MCCCWSGDSGFRWAWCEAFVTEPDLGLLACTVKSGCGEGECSVYFKETSPSYSPNYMFPVLFLLRFYLTLLYFINSVQYDVLTSHNS